MKVNVDIKPKTRIFYLLEQSYFPLEPLNLDCNLIYHLIDIDRGNSYMDQRFFWEHAFPNILRQPFG